MLKTIRFEIMNFMFELCTFKFELLIVVFLRMVLYGFGVWGIDASLPGRSNGDRSSPVYRHMGAN